MADRYWVGGTATWDGTAGTKWATTSGGSGGAAVPTASDDVYFDANSGSGTITITGGTCRHFNTTGFTGTVAGTGSNSPVMFGNLIVGSTNNSWTKTGTVAMTPAAAVSVAISDSGSKLNNTPLTLSGTATSSFVLSTDLNCGTISFSGGTFDLDGFVVAVAGTTGFAISGATTKVLEMTNSVIACQAFGGVPSNLTINMNSGAIIVVGGNFFLNSSATFNFNGFSSITVQNGSFTGGGNSYPQTTMENTSAVTARGLSGVNTFTELAFINGGTNTCSFSINANQTVDTLSVGFSGDPRYRVRLLTDTKGTQRTITVNSDLYAENADFLDLNFTGSGSLDISSDSDLNGDMGNNTGITFSTPITAYWIHGASATHVWSDSGRWFTTSGGSTPQKIPVAHDTAVFDNNSFAVNTRTVTVDINSIGSIVADNLSNTATVNLGNSSICGNVTLASSGSTFTLSGSGPTFIGRGSHTFTQNASTISVGLIFDCAIGDYTFGSNITVVGALSLLSGELNTANYAVNATTFGFTPNLAGSTLNLGSSVLTSTSVSGSVTIFNFNSANLTLNAGTSRLVKGSTNSNVQTFFGGGKTFYELEVPGASGIGQLVIQNSSTFNEIICYPNSKLRFTSGTTNVMNVCNWTGTSGNAIIIDASTSGTPATISKASGVVNCDYLSLKDSTATGGATWNAGSNSTDVSGNSGWNFGAPPVGGTVIVNMVG